MTAGSALGAPAPEQRRLAVSTRIQQLQKGYAIMAAIEEEAHPKSIKRVSRLAVAAHECGHAIARLALDELVFPPGPALRSVEIDSANDQIGVTVMDARCMLPQILSQMPPKEREYGILGLRLDIIETLAGPFAEIRHRARSGWGGVFSMESMVSTVLNCDDHREMGDTEDARIRLDYLLSLRPGKPKEKLEHLAWAAWALVEIEWVGILNMACVLEDAMELDGEVFEREWQGIRQEPHLRERRQRKLGAEPMEALRWATTLGS